VVGQIFAICSDNTCSNTRAISVLTKALNFAFSGFSAAIISARSTFPTSWKNSLAKYKRPKEGYFYVRLQKARPSIKPEVDKIENLVRFDRSKLLVNRSLHKMAFEALELVKRALAVDHLQRETLGSCPTICILHWGRGSKLPLQLTWCLP